MPTTSLERLAVFVLIACAVIGENGLIEDDGADSVQTFF
jgi:hypothetical protein